MEKHNKTLRQIGRPALYTLCTSGGLVDVVRLCLGAVVHPHEHVVLGLAAVVVGGQAAVQASDISQRSLLFWRGIS